MGAVGVGATFVDMCSAWCFSFVCRALCVALWLWASDQVDPNRHDVKFNMPASEGLEAGCVGACIRATPLPPPPPPAVDRNLQAHRCCCLVCGLPHDRMPLLVCH